MLVDLMLLKMVGHGKYPFREPLKMEPELMFVVVQSTIMNLSLLQLIVWTSILRRWKRVLVLAKTVSKPIYYLDWKFSGCSWGAQPGAGQWKWTVSQCFWNVCKVSVDPERTLHLILKIVHTFNFQGWFWWTWLC